MLWWLLLEAFLRISAAEFESLTFQIEAGNSHTFSGTKELIHGAADPLVLVTGVPYLKISLDFTSAPTPLSAKALLALVPESMIQNEALAGLCGERRILDTGRVLAGSEDDNSGSGEIVGNSIVWDLHAGVINALSGSHRRRNTFHVGGDFRFCYTASGSWKYGAMLVPTPYSLVTVYGAVPWPEWSPMRIKPFYCFAGGLEGTNCKVNLEGVVGNATKEGDWTLSNRLTWALPLGWEDTCGTGIALETLGLGRPDAPLMIGGANGLSFDLGYTTNTHESKTFWLCYCSAYNADGGGQPCSDKGDFLQVVGKLHIFSLRRSAASIVPVSSVDLTVRCGAENGCAGNFNNRIKILDPTSWQVAYNRNNFPNWDELSGCRTGLQSVHYVAPPNCVSATSCSALVNGGDHVDYKTFVGLRMDNSFVSGLVEDRDFDVCFCSDNCLDAPSWFKVGVLPIVKPYFVLVENTAFPPLAVINTPGLLNMGTLANDYKDTRTGVTNSLKQGAMVKLLIDDDLDITDERCASGMPALIFSGSKGDLDITHGCTVPASCYPRAWKVDATQSLTFNARFYYGGLLTSAFFDDPLVQSPDISITASRAGMYAICYCEYECEQTTNWGKMQRLELRGPLRNQHWVYQTNIPFNIVLDGWGLSMSNHVKLISTHWACNSPEAHNWEKIHINEINYDYFNASVLTESSLAWELEGHPDGNPIVDIWDFFGEGSTLKFRYPALGSGITNLIKAHDVIVIRNTAIQYDGRFPYTNPAKAKHVELMTVPWGHRIDEPVSGDATQSLFVIPAILRHEDGSVPTWSSSMQASWTRTSEQTYARIESREARKGIRVCWSDNATSPDGFVAEVGTIDLEDAPLMAFSTASLVSTAGGSKTALLISFGTSLGSQVRYRQAENSMMLRISFRDSLVEPRMADTGASVLREDSRYNDLAKEDQIVCGWLFRELWSSQLHGFPVPKGCYYRHDERSYAVVFDPKNGLAESSEYQIVMNVVAKPSLDGQPYYEETPVVRLFSMDDIATRREFAVEVGPCNLGATRFPLLPAYGTESQLNDTGFQLIGGGSSAWLDLTAEDSLTFDIRGLISAPIRPSSHLRIFFFPVTAWRLKDVCEVTCDILHAQKQCVVEDASLPHGGLPQCHTEALGAYDGARRNVANIVLPAGMDEVGGGNETLRVTISGLTWPEGGMFPARPHAELSRADGLMPSYVIVGGKLLYMPPQLTFGGLVSTLVGDGSDRPFRGDKSNALFVRIVLGATLRSQPPRTDGLAGLARFTIMMPNEYACAEVGSVSDTLNVFGSDQPQGRGSLPSSIDNALLGHWALEYNMVQFILNPWGTLHAGSSIFLKLVVDNPTYVLPTTDPRNLWWLSMASFGDTETSISPIYPPGRAFNGGGGSFGNNIAVQGLLVTSIAPIVMMAGAQQNELYVFLRTEQGAGNKAQVRILGPVNEPFDFSRVCEPLMLSSRYYVDLTPQESTYPLPGMEYEINCQGIQSIVKPSHHDGALMFLSGRLRAARQYAFAIRVKNPSEFHLGHRQEWRIQTRTVMGVQVDGTRGTVPLHPRQSILKSFGIFEYQPSQQELETSFALALSSRLPSSVTSLTAWVAIGGIVVPKDVSCQLRVVAPSKYKWQYSSQEFNFRPAEVMPLLSMRGRMVDGTPMVDADLPVGFIRAPLVEPLNELTSPQAANFIAGRRYGLAAKVVVPDAPNTASIDAFFVQCGPEELTLPTRPMAAILGAPDVAALVDLSVGYTNNIVGAANRLRFSVRTTALVNEKGALVIKGPAGFESALYDCILLSVSPSHDAQLVELRSKLIAYEHFIQVQEIKIAVVAAEVDILSLAAEVEARFNELTQAMTSFYQVGVEINALPLDTGCRVVGVNQVRRFIEITLEVGGANMDVDVRLGAFARLTLPELFIVGGNAEATLVPKLFEFQLDLQNPDTARSNPKLALNAGIASTIGLSIFVGAPQGCGRAECWEMVTYASPYSDLVVADKEGLATGFAVVAEMIEAQLANLSYAQRQAIGRNDRPAEPNQLVFTFRLNRVTVNDTEPAIGDGQQSVSQDMLVRAPYGYLFHEDCKVVTAKTEVFGHPDLWDASSGIVEWPGDITYCEGFDNIATFTVVGSHGLQADHLYAFRIDVLANPITTPPANRWALEFYGQESLDGFSRHAEASQPFLGFDQWTFSRVEVLPETTERSDGPSALTINPVTLLFSPFNIVPTGGILRVLAPDIFEWLPDDAEQRAAQSNTTSVVGTYAHCHAFLKERPATLSAAAASVVSAGSLGVSYWKTIGVSCYIDPIFKYIIYLELSGDDPVQSGRDYGLTSDILNPSTELAARGTWQLSSRMHAPGDTARGFAYWDDMDALDVVEELGFPITKGLTSLTITPMSGPSARGGEKMSVGVVAAFVEPIFLGDVIIFGAPPGYSLRAQGTDAISSVAVSGSTKQCLGVINRSKPGVFLEQLLNCFLGLACILKVTGRDLRADSNIQLQRLDRPCGSLPGQDVDIRRTMAAPSPETVTKDYALGVDLTIGTFRVCYCHGDDGCALHSRFCQEVGNLTVAYLCEGVACQATQESCQSRCDPRTGTCIPNIFPAHKFPDGSRCQVGSASPDASSAGHCVNAICLAGAPIAPSQAVTAVAPPGSTQFGSLPPASCNFDVFQCSDRVLRWVIGHEGYERFFKLHFDVVMLHPESSPLEDNLFVLAHERAGIVRGSRVAAAYGILPQFEKASVQLVGPLFAGGALSTLEILLAPVLSATSMWMRIKEPIGFDFGNAVVSTSGAYVLSAESDTIEISQLIMPASQFRFQVNGVRLPQSGGQTLIDIVTYNGIHVRDSMYDIRAFAAPAHLDVLEMVLRNQFKQDTTGTFAVEASFGNRFGEWAQLHMRFGLSSVLSSPCRLRIVGPSWRFSPLSAKIVQDKALSQPTQVKYTVSAHGGVAEDGSADVLDVDLEGHLESTPYSYYLLTADVFAPYAEACACWVAQNCKPCSSNWTVEVVDGSPLPLATNDGLLLSFSLVSELEWSIFVARSPPGARVDLTVRFTRIGSVPLTVMVITGPVGYVFPTICFAPGFSINGSSTNISGGAFEMCAGRLNVAILRLSSPLLKPALVTLSVMTPSKTPADNRWYAEGRRNEGNTQVSWGVAPGPEVKSLQLCTVDYAQFESVATRFLFQFSSDVSITDGGAIAVMPPPGYRLNCDSFLAYNMPRNIIVDVDGEARLADSCFLEKQGVRLSFSEILLAQNPYTFALAGETAALTTAGSKTRNNFAVRIMDSVDQVMEATYEVPTVELLSYGSVEAPNLIWYPEAESGASVWVTVSFRLARIAPAGLRALRVRMPEGLRHAVLGAQKARSETGVSLVWVPAPDRIVVPGTFGEYLDWMRAEQAGGGGANVPAVPVNGSQDLSLGAALPLVADERRWLDLGRPDEVEIRFDPRRSLPACEIFVQFPVHLPNTMPASNAWRLTLVLEGVTVPAGFVVPGFSFAEEPPPDLELHAQHAFWSNGLDYFSFLTKTVSGTPQTRPSAIGSKSLLAFVLLVAIAALATGFG